MGWSRVRMRIVKLSGIIWDASIYGNGRRGNGFVQSISPTRYGDVANVLDVILCKIVHALRYFRRLEQLSVR